MIGCSAQPRTTRITVDDFNDMAEAMAQSLLRSPAVADRCADSPPWIVAIDKVVNLTEDVMTADEQWAVVSMLRGSTPMVNLRHAKNIRFLIERDPIPNPPATMAQLPGGKRPGTQADAQELPGAGAGGIPGVTHTMTATFRDVARTARQARSDLYDCEFELLDLRTGEPTWIDRFEFKRAARGDLWD